MKNKFYNLSIFTLAMFMLENPAFSSPLTINTALTKFGIAMGVVFASCIIIFLLIKVLKNKNGQTSINNVSTEKNPSSLETPKTPEDAIDFYINKNKL